VVAMRWLDVPPVGRVKLPVIFRSSSWLAVCGDDRFWPDAAKEHA
jgi:hypothetical protein